LVQTEREVEALRVVVATSVLDGEGVPSEPLYWILLRIILGNPRGLNFSGRSRLRSRAEKVGKPSFSPAMEDFLRRISSILRRVS
jgi:hypothetical protein